MLPLPEDELLSDEEGEPAGGVEDGVLVVGVPVDGVVGEAAGVWPEPPLVRSAGDSVQATAAIESSATKPVPISALRIANLPS